MALELNGLRVYALGLAHRAVSDISRDHVRQLRNYVDMCAFLANSDAQKSFFDKAQTSLEKADSLYYPLIQRTLATVSEDTICTVGVNLAIDDLTGGGAQLKKAAQESGHPVAWLTVADAGDPTLPLHVCEGEARGQYLWVLRRHTPGDTHAALALAAAHGKSDFALVVPPEIVTAEVAECLAATPNLVLILQMDRPEITDAVHAAAVLLQSRKLFYGLTASLEDSTAALAVDPEWLDVLSQHTLFCVYTHPAMSEPTADSFCKAIYRSRTTTGSPVLLFDWEKDTISIGGFISPLAYVEYWNLPGLCPKEP